MASRTAKRAIKKIVADLSNRRGLGQEWGQIDPEIRREILATWEKAVDDAYTEVVAGKK